MLMATARRYTMEQIEAARKKLRSLPVKEAGKTRGEVAELLVNDIKRAMRQGYTLRDIRGLLAENGVSVPLTKLKALFDKASGLEPVKEQGGAEEDTPRPMRATAAGNGEAQAGYDTKRSGAIKVHALVAPPFGNGSDGVFMLFPCLGFFLLNRLQGKLFDESGDVGRTPYRSARPQLYRFGKTAFLAALPPCAFADGDTFKNLRQA